MKLLFDENLSVRLVDMLTNEYRDSTHVDRAGLRGCSDAAVWRHAMTHGLAIVSKDNDFRQLSALRGHPPKVIWLAVGNAGTMTIRALLAERRADVEAFLADPDLSLLVLRP